MWSAAEGFWVRLAQRIAPYAQLARWDKPTGTWLLYIPGAWSIALAAGLDHASPQTFCSDASPKEHSPLTLSSPLGSLSLQSAFLLGSFLLRGAGCTVNDLWDRDIDRQTARTKQRPLAAGRLPVGHGIGFAAAQTLAGLPILLWISTPTGQRSSPPWFGSMHDTLRATTFFIGASALAPATLYPLAKRFTMWPQAVLGLTFNWGVLLGWSAATDGQFDWRVVLPLYTAAWCWTMVYDTIYAHQDKRTDELLRVGSTALRFGDVHTKTWLRGFTTAMLVNMAVVGIVSEQPWPFYVGTLCMGGHLFHQLYKVQLDDPADCMRQFRRNPTAGLILLVGIAAANWWRWRQGKNGQPSRSPE